MTAETTITRHGRLTCKRAPTDQEHQTWLMREWSDGTIEQYLASDGEPRWVIYQGQYAEEIVWKN